MDLTSIVHNVDFVGECNVWRGAKTSAGYPVVRHNGKNQYVTRIILELTLGRPLSETEYACHSCDNPSCIRPIHLFVGSPSDNQRDAINKGRQRPELHGKLSFQSARRIKKLIAKGVKQRLIAKRFGVTEQEVCNIKKGRAWITA